MKGIVSASINRQNLFRKNGLYGKLFYTVKAKTLYHAALLVFYLCVGGGGGIIDPRMRRTCFHIMILSNLLFK